MDLFGENFTLILTFAIY
jgi:hypothetical protein